MFTLKMMAKKSQTRLLQANLSKSFLSTSHKSAEKTTSKAPQTGFWRLYCGCMLSLGFWYGELAYRQSWFRSTDAQVRCFGRNFQYWLRDAPLCGAVGATATSLGRFSMMRASLIILASAAWRLVSLEAFASIELS